MTSKSVIAELFFGGDYPDALEMRDWFATHAPQPSEHDIQREQRLDRSRNPYNDSDKPRHRERFEIVADLAYQHADAMLKARQK